MGHMAESEVEPGLCSLCDLSLQWLECQVMKMVGIWNHSEVIELHWGDGKTRGAELNKALTAEETASSCGKSRGMPFVEIKQISMAPTCWEIKSLWGKNMYPKVMVIFKIIFDPLFLIRLKQYEILLSCSITLLKWKWYSAVAEFAC